jgi:hypothetical protein
MRPDNPEQARQYVLVARAISFIRENTQQQPSLEQVAVAILPRHRRFPDPPDSQVNRIPTVPCG